jgi:hypothetical protein
MPARQPSPRRTVALVRAILLSATLLAAVSPFPALAQTPETLAGSQVRAAILRSVEAFRRTRNADGTWPDYAQEGGVTALAAYALLEAGVAPDDALVAPAIARTKALKNETTYVTSLKILALAGADPARYKAEIQAAAEWLASTQDPGGAWGYGQVPEDAAARARLGGTGIEAQRSEADLRRTYRRPDTSNTQFAILALAQAARAGVSLPQDVWARADRHLRATQLPGGGWGYVYHDPDPQEAYGSMTAAAVASLMLCHERLAAVEPAQTGVDRLAAAQGGLDWITQRYTLDENPNRDLAWYYFWLYGLERAGVASGRRTFGDHDWFREGAALLVAGQKPDGTWTDRLYHDALCLLFLAKGHRPLLVQRLTWAGAWRKDARDLARLVAFLGDRVGGQEVAWRTLPADARLEEWLASPILAICGRGPPRMLSANLQNLRRYVEQGGLILLDPEGGDAAFTESVRRLMKEQFPEADFRPLAADDPLAGAVHKLTPQGIEVMRIGCRDAVVLAPHGLGDAWAEADPARPDDSLRFGENLAAYAAGGRTLPDRLAQATLLALPPGAAEAPRGAARVGQVQYAGDWNPRPFALPRLLKDVSDRYAVALADRPVPVRLTDDDAATLPILYLTGHGSFALSAEEQAALRRYLDRGGFLWAMACCGVPAFDKSFRDLAAALYPDEPLALLPADHDMYAGKIGTRIERVGYSDAVRAEQPDLAAPVLFGLVRGGHLAVVYSPYGLAPGMDGLHSFGVRTVAPADARRLATNILLYALQP